MLRLRILLIGVFCWIALLVAIGRTDQLPLIGELQPAFYVYLIAAASMGFLILYPEYASKPMQVTFVPLMVIYGACKAVESTGRVIDPPFYYLLTAEVIILVVTTYLARWTSLATSNTEQSIRTALLQLNATNDVLSAYEGEKVISEEILRARRYERPLTLIHVNIPRLHQKRFTRWSQRNLLEYEYVKLRVVQIIRNLIYDSDVIAWHKNSLVVCLPETTREEAAVLALPLQEMLTACVQEPAKVGMAHFPDDALVYDDLLEIAAKAEPPPLPPSDVPPTNDSMVDEQVADKQTADETVADYDITSFAVPESTAALISEHKSA